MGAHTPRRRCVGCGRVAPKSELIRVAVAPGGRGPVREAVLDRTGVLPGRGAYLCPEAGGDEPSARCAALAVRRGGLARALRCAVELAFEPIESVGR